MTEGLFGDGTRAAGDDAAVDNHARPLKIVVHLQPHVVQRLADVHRAQARRQILASGTDKMAPHVAVTLSAGTRSMVPPQSLTHLVTTFRKSWESARASCSFSSSHRVSSPAGSTHNTVSRRGRSGQLGSSTPRRLPASDSVPGDDADGTTADA